MQDLGGIKSGIGWRRWTGGRWRARVSSFGRGKGWPQAWVSGAAGSVSSSARADARGSCEGSESAQYNDPAGPCGFGLSEVSARMHPQFRASLAVRQQKRLCLPPP